MATGLVSEVAISVKGLGKEYRIGRLRPGLKNFRETISDTVLSLLRRTRTRPSGPSIAGREWADRVWALKDVSLEIKRGEVVGIIGGNGAGKSTLLKVLSRITEPTTGTVDIHGRVGSLLEVGTGFHLELTGRENIYLNGAILGMRRREIAGLFDDIVAFAQVEQFIDTPVKHYSSGMYLRLAFSVAAHLETDILLVDEVLAVGDQAFQQKCLTRIDAISRTGRTVLFVSHNMATIERLCERCILLSEGRLVADGDPADVVGEYQSAAVDLTARTDLRSHSGRAKGKVPIMTEVSLANQLGEATACLRMQAGLSVHVRLSGLASPMRPVLGVVVKTALGAPVFGANNKFLPGPHAVEAISEGTITCHFASLPLMPGRYFLDLYCGDWQRDIDVVHEAISFEVVPADVFGTGQIPPRADGPIFWPATFEVKSGQAGL
jgi:lipopolysaccharide transport system ATP-binding protein